MKSDGSDKVYMLEDTETLLPGHVPQSHCLVHAGGQDEEVVAPRNVQQIRCVASVSQKRPEMEA